MSVFLIGNAGLPAITDELRLGQTVRSITVVGVDFNNRPLINDDFMCRFVSRGVIRLIGMSHIRADHETNCFCPLINLFVRRIGAHGYTLQYIGQKAAGRAFAAFAAYFFMIEKGADQRAVVI